MVLVTPRALIVTQITKNKGKILPISVSAIGARGAVLAYSLLWDWVSLLDGDLEQVFCHPWIERYHLAEKLCNFLAGIALVLRVIYKQTDIHK